MGQGPRRPRVERSSRCPRPRRSHRLPAAATGERGAWLPRRARRLRGLPHPEAAPAPVPAAEPDLFSEAEAATEHPAIASQRRWLSDELRGDRDAAAELLHPRFTGVDTRGVSSGKGRILASLAPFPDPVSMEIDGVEELAPWVVLVRWHARSRSAVSAHASVWVKQGDAWRLRFDQATATTR
ncbi:DUF4440 domain-containing protein [Propioniciclava flava]